jgi:hypothetical protein
VEHDYVIFYPSGTRFQLRGVFMFAGDLCAPIVRKGTRAWALDPRAVITRQDLIIYEPRRVVGLPP